MTIALLVSTSPTARAQNYHLVEIHITQTVYLNNSTRDALGTGDNAAQAPDDETDRGTGNHELEAKTVIYPQREFERAYRGKNSFECSLHTEHSHSKLFLTRDGTRTCLRQAGPYNYRDLKNCFPMPDLRYFSLILAEGLSTASSEYIKTKGAYGLVVFSSPWLCRLSRSFRFEVSPTYM